LLKYFLGRGLFGIFIGTALVFLYNYWNFGGGMTRLVVQETFFTADLFVIANVGLLVAGAAGLIKSFAEADNGFSIRRLITVSLMAELFGIGLIPIATLFSARETTPWVVQHKKVVHQYKNGRFFFLEQIPIIGFIPPQNAEYVMQEHYLEWLCYWQGCLDNAVPFVFGSPTTALLALWIRKNGKERSREKTCNM
jgi:hypothetical protein